MKFAFTLLSIAAALRLVGAGPVAAEGLTKRAPVPVTKLVFDGNSNKCTAYLDFDDGNWIAQWSTSVFYQDPFGYLTEKPMTTKSLVPVTDLTCDGIAYKCSGKLDWGDGNWVAQWSTEIFHQALFSQEGVTDTVVPVPVRELSCDGGTHKCTADLVWGDGNWVAQWETAISHQCCL